jgi:hypothetical protein
MAAGIWEAGGRVFEESLSSGMADHGIGRYVMLYIINMKRGGKHEGL